MCASFALSPSRTTGGDLNSTPRRNAETHSTRAIKPPVHTPRTLHTATTTTGRPDGTAVLCGDAVAAAAPSAVVPIATALVDADAVAEVPATPDREAVAAADVVGHADADGVTAACVGVPDADAAPDADAVTERGAGGLGDVVAEGGRVPDDDAVCVSTLLPDRERDCEGDGDGDAVPEADELDVGPPLRVALHVALALVVVETVSVALRVALPVPLPLHDML